MVALVRLLTCFRKNFCKWHQQFTFRNVLPGDPKTRMLAAQVDDRISLSGDVEFLIKKMDPGGRDPRPNAIHDRSCGYATVYVQSERM